MKPKWDKKALAWELECLVKHIEHKALLGAVNRLRILDGGRNGGWFIDRFSDADWEKLVDAILGKYRDA